ARRMEPQSAEDAVQEIFLDVWKCAGSYDPGRAAESTFVATIARRRLIDRRRRAGRVPAVVDLAGHADGLIARGDGVERQAPLADETAAAKAALAELRPEQRAVLEMLLLDGKTYA